MRLELIITMGLVSVIFCNTHFPIDSRLFPSLQPNLHFGLLPEKNYNDYEPVARHQRNIHGWTMAKPLYVEEPGWILIEDPYYTQIGQRNYVTNREDPFYITRGKRISMEYSQDYERGQRSSRKRIDDDTAYDDAKAHFDDTLSNNSHSPIYYQLNRADAASGIQNDEIQQRDKHSDIIDMLQEPFVISRGKKNSNKRDGHEQFFHEHEFNDDTLLRYRRGKLFDQLMKEKDPFYVARGKRQYPIVHRQL